MRRSFNPSNLPRDGPQSQWTPKKGSEPANYRSVKSPHHFQSRPDYSPNSRGDRPPGQKPRPNFIVELRSEHGPSQKDDVRDLIDRCKSKPDDFSIFRSCTVVGKLFFQQWCDALETILNFWELRFDGVHCLTPSLISNVIVPSDYKELCDQLKALFVGRIEGFIKGSKTQNWQKKLNDVLDEIADISATLKKFNGPNVFEELAGRRKRLFAEREIIAKRIKEFKIAMGCILDHLTGKRSKECGDQSVDVLRLVGEFNWSRIYWLIMREIRRLDDGLPIYAFRQEILNHIASEQVMVLIGETGSGKSTQLVQFLTDSGLAADGSIICTQPRKIAAISLADRVKEECNRCVEDDKIMFSSNSSPSSQQLDSKVIFMTDHCLLQQYMNDKSLGGVSCIIVDEAHERSLNTDLLLALLKDLLTHRLDMKLIIMSATADANQLSNYFFKCQTYNVLGRNFPIDIRYVPCAYEGTSRTNAVGSYVADVVRMASEIHKSENEGTILAFLTSQMEVEWACEKFEAPYAVALPLHGKLSSDDQFRVFQNYPGKRKVIFTTNLAETSLTIPGVKYVIDSGMVKESKFEPGTGMNVLKVCRVSQSAANQRAGRAGRTEPGRCYRLYSSYDFQSMSTHQEPEIRRVHLGLAVLKILALGVKDVQAFDFVDAPSAKAIEMAIRNLVQLGAVTFQNGVIALTEEGKYFVKLGIEPRLGKIIMNCFRHRLGREGIVLAAVMANASSIFCRVGNEEEKLKSDSLKLQFCHCNGDLFTLLSVYKEWEGLAVDARNKWCWEQSVNAKSMRRCHDTVGELEKCLRNELNFIVPTYWLWAPNLNTEHDKNLKKSILSSLSENIAMYSGNDQLGYEVALTGQHVQLHPSCSLHIFGQKPTWVVFGEILSISNQYLVCVSAFDFESLANLSPPPLFDFSTMESRKLQVRVIPGFSNTLLKRFCGKFNNSLHSFVSRIRSACSDDRIRVEINADQNEIVVFASSKNIEKVCDSVDEALEFERNLMENECMEKCLFQCGPGVLTPVALLGSGAEIRHLELEKKSLSVDIYHSDVNSNALDDKEFLMFLEKSVSSSICAVQKSTVTNESQKWGRITFICPDAAKRAAELNEVKFNGCLLKIIPSTTFGGDTKNFSFAAVRAKVYWPRRRSKGLAFIKCRIQDVESIIDKIYNLEIEGELVRVQNSRKSADSIVISGIDKELSENEILDALSIVKDDILDFFLVREEAVEDPRCGLCEEAIYREISPFLPKKNPNTSCCRVQVFQSGPRDPYMRASITFDGRMHLEAAKALEGLEGKVLPGCHPWQKIKCQQLFQSSVSCPASIYKVIKTQLNSLLACSTRRKGAECYLESNNDNGSIRVKISANATKTVAELRKPFEQLMRGKTIEHPSLTPTLLQHLFSRDGIFLMKSIQDQTQTYILFDRHNLNVKIFGSDDNITLAEQRLVQSLQTSYEKKQLEIHLRGVNLPPDLMKEVVKKFGPDLHGLKKKVPGAELTLNIRRHVISLSGNKEMKQIVEELVYDIARTSICETESLDSETTCPICLCEVEDGFRLIGCGHIFCQSCLVEQCESAIKSRDSFPILCTHKGCKVPIFLTDLRSLLMNNKLEELFRASLGSFVATSGGKYRFCPTPDCPSVYKVSDSTSGYGELFVCGSCYVETCTSCHLEYHQYISCEKYKEFKDDPDTSLNEWRKGKEEHVKCCPVCGYTIEKIEGCNHIECRCGRHICWVCLEVFGESDECYNHLRAVHLAIV